jgi:hypothetical protein
MGFAKNLNFVLRFTNTFSGLMHFSGLGKGNARDFSSLYLVLFDPAVKDRATHIQIGRGFLRRLTGSNQ